MKVLMSGETLLLYGKGVSFMKHRRFLPVVSHRKELFLHEERLESAHTRFSQSLLR